MGFHHMDCNIQKRISPISKKRKEKLLNWKSGFKEHQLKSGKVVHSYTAQNNEDKEIFDFLIKIAISHKMYSSEGSLQEILFSMKKTDTFCAISLVFDASSYKVMSLGVYNTKAEYFLYWLSNNDFQFWTRPDYRRLGLGKVIIENLESCYKVSPDNDKPVTIYVTSRNEGFLCEQNFQVKIKKCFTL